MKRMLISTISLMIVVVIVVAGFIIYRVVNTNSSVQMSGDRTVYLSVGTLSDDTTKVWEHVLESDDATKLDGNSYKYTVIKFDSNDGLKSAIKSQDVYFGIGLTQQDVTNNLSSSSNSKPQVIRLASNESEFKGFKTFAGLKQGGMITSENVQSAKQTEFIGKIVNIYNNQMNQKWIQENYPNYK
ncbi:hypothetical protein AB3K25_09100 [Leuconostoc sp. MS02]|uniref:Uncharacterized protein n=1 Tax=Leuconostoc aquikimchii TaxID=3236804 RepID=A0ABV3S0M3_9LACO